MTNLFKVEGQTLTPIEIYPAVSDTVNYLTFAFMFSYDWAGLTKSAIFTSGASIYEVPLTDDEVLESDRVNLSAGVWEISVVGDTVVDAVVTRQITTSSYNFNVTQASATSGGVFPPSIASQVYVNVNQSTPQTLVGGIPLLASTRTINADHQIVDKKYVDDHTPPTPVHNDLGSLQGGGETERYHMTQAENTALHAHGNKTALDLVSGTNTGDQVLPTRDSLGLNTDDTVTFANLSGTNTGDQDVSGAISTHNTATDAHSILARKTATMQLLISRTIGAGENVSAITWTQDDAGSSLSLIDPVIAITVPQNTIAVGISGFITFRFNNKSGSSDYFSSIQGTSYSLLHLGAFRSLYGYSTTTFKTIGSKLMGEMVYLTYDGTTYARSSLSVAMHDYAATVTTIYASISGLTYFPDGTVIKIYGRAE